MQINTPGQFVLGCFAFVFPTSVESDEPAVGPTSA